MVDEPSDRPAEAERVRAIARGIYEALERTEGALVQGEPEEGECTLLDGYFNLWAIALELAKRDALWKAE